MLAAAAADWQGCAFLPVCCCCCAATQRKCQGVTFLAGATFAASGAKAMTWLQPSCSYKQSREDLQGLPRRACTSSALARHSPQSISQQQARRHCISVAHALGVTHATELDDKFTRQIVDSQSCSTMRAHCRNPCPKASPGMLYVFALM